MAVQQSREAADDVFQKDARRQENCGLQVIPVFKYCRKQRLVKTGVWKDGYCKRQTVSDTDTAEAAGKTHVLEAPVENLQLLLGELGLF